MNYAKGYCRKCYTTYLRISEKRKLELFAKLGKTIKAGVKNIECITEPDGVPLNILTKADLEVLEQYDSKWPIQKEDRQK